MNRIRRAVVVAVLALVMVFGVQGPAPTAAAPDGALSPAVAAALGVPTHTNLESWPTCRWYDALTFGPEDNGISRKAEATHYLGVHLDHCCFWAYGRPNSAEMYYRRDNGGVSWVPVGSWCAAR